MKLFVKVKAALSNGFDFVCKIVFPPKCIFCGMVLEPNCRIRVCGKCYGEIEFCSDKVCCVRCGKPILGYGKKQLCYHCVNNSNSFTRIASVFSYEGAVKDSIKKFKKKGLRGHEAVFVNCLAARFNEEYPEISFDFLCGAPPHDKKKDFDQVDLLCKGLSKNLDIPYAKGIFKQTRKTEKQSMLGYAERRKNMKDSLETVGIHNFIDKTVLLIDDVCTTRSTINECSRALKKAGAKKVYALTVATVKNPE